MKKMKYPVIDGHKECRECHIIKQVDQFPPRTNPSGSISPSSSCKECRKNYSTKYNRLRGIGVSRRYPIIDDHKKCTGCNDNKHISDYDIKWNGKMFAMCKTCLKAYRDKFEESDKRKSYIKEWYDKNKDKLHNKNVRYNKLAVQNLESRYIRNLLTRHLDIKPIEIPQELVEIKRKQMLLSRQIKQSKSL